jgi:regulator of replication initiation timing
MITIIGKKKWRKLMDDQQRTRDALARYDDVTRNLVRRIGRLEKDIAKMAKENRALKSEIRKLKDRV